MIKGLCTIPVAYKTMRFETEKIFESHRHIPGIHLQG